MALEEWKLRETSAIVEVEAELGKKCISLRLTIQLNTFEKH